MAGLLPATTSETSEDLERADFRSALASAIHLGKTPAQIAAQLHPNDRTRRRAMTRRIKRMVIHDQELQKRVGELAQAELVMGMGKATRGLVRAAGRGRTEASKLIFEATGFHTPKTKHEHSGEIKVKLDIPRPPVLDDTSGQAVVDADVVEDE